MNILHTVYRYYPAVAGSENYMKELSEYLATLGHDVTVYTSDIIDIIGRDVYPFKHEKRNGVTVNRYSFFPFRNRLAGYLLYSINSIATSLEIESLSWITQEPLSLKMIYGLFNSNPDIIHTTAIPQQQCYFSIKTGNRKNIPVIITPFLHYNILPEERLTLIVSLLKKCDRILANTHYEMEYLLKKGIAEEKLEKISMGVHFNRYQKGDRNRWRNIYGIDDGDLLILYMGTKTYDKGAIFLLNCAVELTNEIDDIHFIFAGQETGEFTAAYTKITKIRNRIHSVGTIFGQEKVDLFHSADIFAMPSIADAFGMVYLEAWASGKAVVGAKTGAMLEVIGDRGLLVEFGDTEDLKNKLETLICDSNLQRELGEKGKKYAKSCDWDKIIPEIYEIYDELSREHTK